MASLVRALVASFAVAGCATGPSSASAPPSSGLATDFALNSLDGKVVRLSDHLGKDVVLLDFWATWCTPCLAEMPHLEAIWRAHREKGLVVLGISIDGPETVSNVDPVMRRYGVSFPVLLDEETRVQAQYNPARDAPFAVLIDRSGKVVERRAGYQPGDEKSLEARLVELLAAPASP